MIRLWECMVATGIVVVVGTAIYPMKVACACTRATTVQCISNIKQLSMSLQIYAVDNDDRLPNRLHWVDNLKPYVGKTSAFVDPLTKRKGAYGYAYDSRLSSKSLSAFADPAHQSAMFDSTNSRKNAADPLLTLPNPGRHYGSNNVGYLDSHVKRLLSK